MIINDYNRYNAHRHDNYYNYCGRTDCTGLNIIAKVDLEENLKKKFNSIDYMIIGIVILGLAGGFFMFNKKKNQTVETKQESEITLSFYIPDVENATLAPIKVGNRAIDTRKKTDLGVLESMELKDAEAFAIGADGLSHVYSKPDYSAVDLKLKSKGNISSDGIYIGRYKYLIGDWVILNIGQSTVYAVINGVER